MPFISPPVCEKCGVEIRGKHRCNPDVKYIDRIRSLCKFNDDIKKIIHYYKYKSVWSIEKIFSIPLSNLILSDSMLKKADFISYVPLHPLKRMMRGFNQSRILAQSISSITKIPLVSILKRIKYTKSQTKIKNPEKRKLNIRGAFGVKKSTTIKDKNIIVVDDVITTGATMNEIARILKKSNAGSVYAVTLASAMS